MLIAIIIVFCLGYLFIAMEHTIEVNKTATALITGVLCWTIYALYSESEHITHQLLEQLGEVSSILFFLMGAMTIVELIDAHDGFDLINSRIQTKSRKKLLWVICLLTFFLSAVLDNLTTTIVMVTLIGKIVKDNKLKMIFVGMIIIAANAGGAWSPIGDVTTTMLWIGGQISTTAIIARLIVPSLICLLVPLAIVTMNIKGELRESGVEEIIETTASSTEQRVVFFSGLIGLLFVPAFKTITHLPPFMGMLLSLGALWLLTELIHRKKDEEQKKQLSVLRALERMDVPSVLFFLGILLAVGVLQNTGILMGVANWLNGITQNETIIVSIFGIISAIVDNVPLVAATMAMYPLDLHAMDSGFWILLAFCSGTGGSLLIIGSAAGVAAMGLEKIPFGWYLKNITWLAFAGYVAGILSFLLQEYLLS